jgi:2-polyprenyl-6-hydroxyphenyl methylase/3-demethylubiquinone-9 3-methyltransferase
VRTRSHTPNDPRLYDELAHEWWRPRGAFAPLHWLATARAALVPPPSRPGAYLLDLACGGGLLAPHVAHLGYHHLGIDIGASATHVAREHGIAVIRGDVQQLPIASATIDVVVAGEIFEHVRDLERMVAEIGRVLRPGGTLVCDTLADTRRCAFLLVTVGERLPVVPRGIHDPALFVAPSRLRQLCATHGIDLAVHGIRPSIPQTLAWLAHRRDTVAMRPTRSTRIVYQGLGVKRP